MKAIKYFTCCVFLLLTVSCNKSEPDIESQASIKVDFLINNADLETLGFDYNADDLDLLKFDPDKVYFAQVGEDVEFKDISASDVATEKTWLLDGQEWKSSNMKAADVPAFNYKFEVAGLYKVSLSFNQMNIATKYVRVMDKLDQSISFEQRLAKNDNSDVELENDVVEGQVKFESSTDHLTQGQSVTFTDMSDFDSEIGLRIWDFGDGTIMPTKGNKVKYNYILSGTYEVKLCLDPLNMCATKVIRVDPKQKTEYQKKIDQVKMKEADKAAPSDNQFFRFIGFDAPSKVVIGQPLRLTDKSSPNAMVWKRDWFINGEKQNYSQQYVDMVFDEVGNYEIKMCLNNQRANCVEKSINVYAEEEDLQHVYARSDTKIEISEPKEKSIQKSKTVAKTSKNAETRTIVKFEYEEEFICRSYSKAGFKSRFRCLEDKLWFEGEALIKLKPKTTIELLNAKAYGNATGLADVIISSEGQRVLGRTDNIQILPGYTSLEFSEMGITLEAGVTYYMHIIPQEYKGKYVKFENGIACRQFFEADKNMDIEYDNDAYILYDIKYCH